MYAHERAYVHERTHARGGGGGCACASACACRRPLLFAPNWPTPPRSSQVGNLLLFPQIYGPGCLNIMAQHLPPPGFGDAFVNNTCILSDAGQDAVSLYPDALQPPAEFGARLALGGNAFLARNASTRFQGPGDAVDYRAWQAQGYDASSAVSGDVPDAPTVISWARALLLAGEGEAAAREVRAG